MSNGTGSETQDRLNIFVLSPHRDDAAFSLSLSIDAWLREGHSITIINIFTRSLYAPYLDTRAIPENALLTHISAVRKREDNHFIRHIPRAKMIDLDLNDAPLRLNCTSVMVCDMPVDLKDEAFAEIGKALTALAGVPAAVLLIPLALGHHVDHRVVRDAALPFSADLPCAFYEDLPYATRDGASIDLKRFRDDVDAKYQKHLHPVVCYHSRSVDWKRTVVLEYTSQILDEAAQRISNFAHRYRGNERIWANDKFINLVKISHLGRVDDHFESLPA